MYNLDSICTKYSVIQGFYYLSRPLLCLEGVSQAHDERVLDILQNSIVYSLDQEKMNE